MKPATSICLIAIVCSAVIAAVYSTYSSAQGLHGDGHDALHEWYETLRDRKGKSCCDRRDCRPTKSRFNGTNVEVMVDGIWAAVPPEKILSVPSPDLGSHVCSPKRPNSFPLGYVVCVVVGPGI